MLKKALIRSYAKISSIMPKSKERENNLSPIMNSSSQDGFALIVVLWGLVLIGLIVAHLVGTGRTATRIVMNQVANAEASAAADGAIHTAVFYFLDTHDQKRWAANGQAHELNIGAVKVKVRLIDEAGRINPNIASESLMASLLRVIGVDSAQAADLAGAIFDWVSPAELDLARGAKTDAYRSAGLDYGPPGSPFISLDEINRVLGMTPEIAARLRPHLSIWSKGDPIPELADPVVLQALEGQSRLSEGVLPQVRRQYFLTIEATAAGPTGAIFTRRAVVGVNFSFERGFKVLTWEAPLAE